MTDFAIAVVVFICGVSTWGLLCLCDWLLGGER